MIVVLPISMLTNRREGDCRNPGVYPPGRASPGTGNSCVAHLKKAVVAAGRWGGRLWIRLFDVTGHVPLKIICRAFCSLVLICSSLRKTMVSGSRLRITRCCLLAMNGQEESILQLAHLFGGGCLRRYRIPTSD